MNSVALPGSIPATIPGVPVFGTCAVPSAPTALQSQSSFVMGAGRSAQGMLQFPMSSVAHSAIARLLSDSARKAESGAIGAPPAIPPSSGARESDGDKASSGRAQVPIPTVGGMFERLRLAQIMWRQGVKDLSREVVDEMSRSVGVLDLERPFDRQIYDELSELMASQRAPIQTVGGMFERLSLARLLFSEGQTDLSKDVVDEMIGSVSVLDLGLPFDKNIFDGLKELMAAHEYSPPGIWNLLKRAGGVVQPHSA
jgi:hypothetical protein